MVLKSETPPRVSAKGLWTHVLGRNCSFQNQDAGASCNAHMCAGRPASGARVQLQAGWISAIKHPDVGFGLHPLNSTKVFFHSLVFILKTSMQLVENSKARPIRTSPGNVQRKQRSEWGLWWGLGLPTHSHSPGHREAWSCLLYTSPTPRD